LNHVFDGRTLKRDFAELTLKNLFSLWKKSVYIETAGEDGKSQLWGFDGKDFLTRA
jgi:spore cortex formation protein SpoVR/YcgB (stage V sporulation)